ncbi:ABC transporter substrate-binding protein [Candidatus Solirubrobacter pratensis]|uniref:ABC transporter substrate-binding protein n=1 Tax=Candidatus Solirubrobacter pratensis TaxID=1298857 RepID=UPI00041D1F6C|nr:ABC transporter substrate-binding protein [Candidatus Solirubrobacter pratensis]
MSRSIQCIIGVLLALSLAACGSKGEESGGGGNATGSVKTGPGVTDKTITLGLLTDLSGVFAPLGKPIVQSTQLYWKERNAQGGVCNRTVKLVVKDHGYDPQKAVVQYREMASGVAGLQQLLGSPITAALLPTLKSDKMLALLAAWPSSLLPNDNIVITGTTYDVEMINGLEYLLQKGKLKQGDKIGHVYFEGEYGENGLKGSKYFASKHGMTVVEQKIKATDEDMSGQVAALKRAGVKAIAVTTAPTQLASLAGIGAAQGLKVPILGNNPTYDPALLNTPAAKALKSNAYIVTSIATFNLDKPAVKKTSADFEKAYPKALPKASVPFGNAQSRLMDEILGKACENKDLSRQGLVTAAHQLSGVDMGGLTAAPLDYTKPGQPSERAVYITRPANVPGGLQADPETYESDTAKNYDVGAQ